MHSNVREAKGARVLGRPGLLKDLNTKAVFEHVAEVGGASRVALADALGLSATSVSRITDALIRGGLLLEGAQIASRIGRRQTLLEIQPGAASVIAVDIRTNSVRFTLSDLRGERVAHVRVPMAASDVDSAVALVASEVARLAETVPRSRVTVVVGVPGAWDSVRQRVYCIPNIPFLHGVNLASALERRLDTTVLIDNDVNFAALGEYHFGAGAHVEDLFYLNLGSGVGGGLVVGGRLHRGHSGFAGEIGSLPVLDSASDTFVTLESLIGRPALDARLQQRGWPHGIEALLREPFGQHAEVVEFLADRCALAIAATTSSVDPGLAVLGGSIGRHGASLIPLVERALARLSSHRPPIAPTRLGEDAALLGATAVGLARTRSDLVERLASDTVR